MKLRVRMVVSVGAALSGLLLSCRSTGLATAPTEVEALRADVPDVDEVDDHDVDEDEPKGRAESLLGRTSPEDRATAVRSENDIDFDPVLVAVCGIPRNLVTFAPGESRIGRAERVQLDRVVSCVTGSNAASMRIVLTGHTSELGSRRGNMELARERAASVGQYLVERGIDPSRIMIVAMGETTASEHAHRGDRVEINVTPR